MRKILSRDVFYPVKVPYQSGRVGSRPAADLPNVRAADFNCRNLPVDGMAKEQGMGRPHLPFKGDCSCATFGFEVITFRIRGGYAIFKVMELPFQSPDFT